VLTEKGYGKMSSAEDYRLTKRGAKGVLTINATERNGNIVAMRAVDGLEDLMIITTEGVMIRIPLSQVKVSGRATQGVRVIRLKDNHQVSSIAVVATANGEDEEDHPADEELDEE
jgi:DNA gyrase subunit A